MAKTSFTVCKEFLVDAILGDLEVNVTNVTVDPNTLGLVIEVEADEIPDNYPHMTLVYQSIKGVGAVNVNIPVGFQPMVKQ